MTLEINKSFFTIMVGYGNKHGPTARGKPAVRGKPLTLKIRGKPAVKNTEVPCFWVLNNSISRFGFRTEKGNELPKTKHKLAD